MQHGSVIDSDKPMDARPVGTAPLQLRARDAAGNTTEIRVDLSTGSITGERLVVTSADDGAPSSSSGPAPRTGETTGTQSEVETDESSSGEESERGAAWLIAAAGIILAVVVLVVVLTLRRRGSG